MGLDLPKAMAEVEKDPMHHFTLQTPQGVAQLKVPHSAMKECPCGSDLFDLQYHVTWVKPNGVLGAAPMCLRAEVYVCVKCGEKLTQQHKSVGEKKIVES